MPAKKILILDDEQEMLELLHLILESNYEIVSRSDTKDFEETIHTFKPDVIIIDHFIGDKQSQEIIANYAKDLKNIPVILHSAHEEIERIAEAEKVSGFIKKPSSIKEIRAKIQEVISLES